jgi:hypothetical protein
MSVANRHRVPAWAVYQAIETVTGHSIHSGTALADEDLVLRHLGAVDRDVAKRITSAALDTRAQLEREARDSCRYCGLPLLRGRCEECV